jgi:hypothetical protein
MPSTSVLETARKLVAAGISVIPIRCDGSKAPAGKLLPLDEDDTSKTTWKPYQERLPTDKELAYWFARENVGLAIVAGEVSGNLEILDLDSPAIVKPWRDAVEAIMPSVVSRLVVVKTPREGHGRHIYYRCPVIDGNMKLALDADKHCLAESRGEGGYALHPASPPQCHPTNRCYRLVQGSFDAIPVVTEDERDVMLSVSRGFNQCVEQKRAPYVPSEHTAPVGDRPGDMFAARISWGEILEPHGWVAAYSRGDITYWRRPGKKGHGTSASTGYCGDNLHVFSSNGWPFEPEGTYSKFTAFALLNHGGDFVKAAVALAALGYVNRHKGELSGGYRGVGAHRTFGTFGAYRGAVSRG